MSRRANERGGSLSPLPAPGSRGSGVRSGAGPLPAEGTQLGSTVVPPVELGMVPPEEVGSTVSPPVGAVPPLPADRPPLAACAVAGAMTRRAMRAATARRIGGVIGFARAPAIPARCRSRGRERPDQHVLAPREVEQRRAAQPEAVGRGHRVLLDLRLGG